MHSAVGTPLPLQCPIILFSVHYLVVHFEYLLSLNQNYSANSSTEHRPHCCSGSSIRLRSSPIPSISADYWFG